MNRLKALRKDKKISQSKLSKEINVNLRTIQRWEDGVNQIKPGKAQQLADYFEVSIGYLLGYDEEPKLFDKSGSKLPTHKQYILKINNIAIDLVKQSDNMSAQNLSYIKTIARELYETLVWLQYETEKVEG